MQRLLRLGTVSFLSLVLTSAASAVPLHPCLSSAYTAYYVLWNPVGTPFEVDTHSGSLGGSHEIDELVLAADEAILSIVCSANEATWLSQNHLVVAWWGPITGGATGELFAVYNSTTWDFVGTVWRDLYEPFDQGGAMGYQKYWSRTAGGWSWNPFLWSWVWIPPANPVVQNVAMFSSGLDRNAINGTSETEKDAYWFTPISGRLNSALDNHIRWVENYPYQYTKQQFMSTFGNNVNALRHDDLVDPTGGEGGFWP